MEEEIKKAIELLERNGYTVVGMTAHMCDAADRCSETGCGDCMDCPCFICAAGLDGF